MTLTSATPTGLPAFPSDVGRKALRRRALSNVLRAGHCAPTVMKTLAGATGAGDGSWLVQLAGGLPGGIGGTGNECGAITASLVVLGLRHARDPDEDGVPVVVSKGRALLQDFQACHGSCACRELLWHGVPVRCLGVIRRAPERCVDIDARRCGDALPDEERRACARLHAHLVEKGFHCAHAVLQEASGDAPEPALLDATSAFVAGTAYAGLTCSALTAGVMLLGLGRGGAEPRPGRVLRAMAAMATGGHAFAADLDAISGAMNEGPELARSFRKEFGSTRCRDVVGADLSSVPGVLRYIETDGVRRCREVARAVAARVREMRARV
jgi:C_GCAxxG_C_C family probable redox protein